MISRFSHESHVIKRCAQEVVSQVKRGSGATVTTKICGRRLALAAGGVVLLAGLVTGCAAKRDQFAYGQQLSRMNCPNGAVTVMDTVIVTGANGQRQALQRQRTQCVPVVAP